LGGLKRIAGSGEQMWKQLDFRKRRSKETGKVCAFFASRLAFGLGVSLLYTPLLFSLLFPEIHNAHYEYTIKPINRRLSSCCSNETP
jgi:hypothetical protein